MSETSGHIFSLPLFPLHTVLLPQAPIQLHVFEERYRVMIGGCIERKEPFGVVQIKEGSEVGQPAVPEEIGCMAEIFAVKVMDDGRMHLLAGGTQRFRILEYAPAELPYLVGRVELVPDEDVDADDLDSWKTIITELFLSYVESLTGRDEITAEMLQMPTDPALLSYYVVSVLQMPREILQMTLEETNPLHRLQIMETYLTHLMESGGDETESFILALPLDAQQDRWQKYRMDGRN
jgi:uncharacterized protein